MSRCGVSWSAWLTSCACSAQALTRSSESSLLVRLFWIIFGEFHSSRHSRTKQDRGSAACHAIHAGARGPRGRKLFSSRTKCASRVAQILFLLVQNSVSSEGCLDAAHALPFSISSTIPSWHHLTMRAHCRMLARAILLAAVLGMLRVLVMCLSVRHVIFLRRVHQWTLRDRKARLLLYAFCECESTRSTSVRCCTDKGCEGGCDKNSVCVFNSATEAMECAPIPTKAGDACDLQGTCGDGLVCVYSPKEWYVIFFDVAQAFLNPFAL
jgi:hypothetical protein